MSASRLRAVRSSRFSTRFMWWRTSFANQSPRFAMEGGVGGEDTRGVAPGLEHDHADLGPVEAQVEQHVVQLAEGAQRPQLGAPRRAWPRRPWARRPPGRAR